MSKRAYKNTIITLIILIAVCFFALPFTSSKYTQVFNRSVTLNIAEPKYFVRYNANNGTGTMADQEFTYSVAQNLTQNSFTRTGYTFAGWNTKADGTGTSYSNTQSVSRLSEENGAIFNLYAQWNPITYTIHFDANGGTGSMANQSFAYDEQKALTANSFTKTGASFNGWNTAADGTGTGYTDEEQVQNLTTVNGDTITFYAQWVAADYSLTITNFNKSIGVIYTEYLLGIIPIRGYKVLGITIQNNHSFTINNWTVEFTSDRQVETNRPNNNRLSNYLDPSNYYGSVSQSGENVTVIGNDTLAPGATKTVYVFFPVTVLSNDCEFNNETAYYTPNRGVRNAPAKAAAKINSSVKMSDEKTYEGIEIRTVYDTTIDKNNIYSTNMYVYIANSTENDITNIKFDVEYNSLNTSKISSKNIDILSDSEKGATFMCDEKILKDDYKYYIVTGIKTEGGFNGMNISNVSYENVK